MLDEFFHFSYYLIIPLTGILLFRKDVKLFESFVFQLSSFPKQAVSTRARCAY